MGQILNQQGLGFCLKPSAQARVQSIRWAAQPQAALG